MQRLANPKNGGQYAFYYTVIKGFGPTARQGEDDLGHHRRRTTSTIVFNLTEADAATSSTGWRCRRRARSRRGRRSASTGKAGKYGRDLVSTGPYMIKGIDKVDISSCAKLKPASGFDGQTHHDLVRNPNYDASDRLEGGRENYPTSSSSSSTRTPTTSSTRSRPASSTTATSTHPAAGPAEVRRRTRA